MNEPAQVDRRPFSEAVARLRDSGIDRFDVDAAIRQVLVAAVELFGLTGAGLMIVDGDEVLRTVGATDPAGELLERVQEEIGEGPCVDSLHLDRVVTTVDVSNDRRWPRLADRLRPHRIGGVLGVPVRLAGAAVGALDVYRDEPHEWDDNDVEALSAFGRVLETVLATAVLANRQEELVQQLQTALDNRVEIERAVGLLMGRHDLDAVAAFNRLRRQARSERRPAVEVARDVLGRPRS